MNAKQLFDFFSDDERYECEFCLFKINSQIENILMTFNNIRFGKQKKLSLWK